ncbi:alpha/beta fold hydrolase [Shewanella aestuarii]|uniref:Alpha/beta hydrolase n=1 Tax=Shewanella aestuarii TaxID=1028752 RepID=A0A6G9QK62_9GAMM|nr:alpha/beta hydrolase [Shewanella aestuarii]QIR14916.1 alpha/beta hydrolase [Shewanella aestuarii]
MTAEFDLEKLNYVVSGNGPALVWAHGLLGSMQSEDALGIYAWHRFAKNLQLLRYDAPGHGLSLPTDNQDDFLWSNLGRLMLQMADEKLFVDNGKAVPFVLGGQSMGCASSLHAALAAPELLRGLILMNPPTAWQTRSKQKQQFLKIAKAAKILGAKGFARINAKHIDRMLPNWIIDAHKHSVLGMLDGLKGMKKRTLHQVFSAAAVNDLPALNELTQIKVPCLILAWDDDATHPLETANMLAKTLPNAQLHVAKCMADVEEWPELIVGFCRTVTN